MKTIQSMQASMQASLVARIALATATACVALLPLTASAQTDPRTKIRAAVSGALTPILGESAGPIVERVMQVRPDGAISRNFDLGRVTTALFGRTATTTAPDCRGTKTRQGEPEEGLCVVDLGDRDSETGAYSMLAFSKNIGMGDVMYASRPAVNPGQPVLPQPVRLSDREAYDQALQMLALLGVPSSEIPVPPQGANSPLPVRTLAVGAEDKRGGDTTRIDYQKVVSIPRAFVVPGGLYTDPATGRTLKHVLAPGRAIVATDGLVQFAQVEGWSDAQMDPKLDVRQSKSTQALINEITDDLYGEGVREVGTLSVLVSLRRAYPNPEDPNPPLCPVCGVLRPALQVLVSQRGVERVQTSERDFAAPGLVREYDLVEAASESPAR